MKIYDSNQGKLIVAGIPIESGRGDAGGTFLSIEFLNDAFVDEVSLDGQVTRSKTNDNRATAKVTLMSSSESNDFLSALHTADKLAENGAGVGAFLYEDLNGTTVYAAAECWVVKAPKLDKGQKAVPLEWEIRIANLVEHVGGN